jgi:hypothetical protein
MWYRWLNTYPDVVPEEISHDAFNDVKADVCSILIIYGNLIIPGVSHV